MTKKPSLREMAQTRLGLDGCNQNVNVEKEFDELEAQLRNEGWGEDDPVSDVSEIMKTRQGKTKAPKGLYNLLKKETPDSHPQTSIPESYFGITRDSESLIHKSEAELAKMYKGIISSGVDSELIDKMYEAAFNKEPKYNASPLFGVSTILTLYKNIGSVKYARSAEDMKAYSCDFDELFYQVMAGEAKKINKNTKRWKQADYLNNVLSPEAKARFVEGFCNEWPTTKREAPDEPSAIYEPESANGYKRFIIEHLEKKDGEMRTKLPFQ